MSERSARGWLVPWLVTRCWRALKPARCVICHEHGTRVLPRPRDHLGFAVSSWGGCCGSSSWGAGGALSFAVGVAFDDELVAGGGEPVDGGLGEELVVHEGEPFVGGAVGGDDGGVLAVAGDGELVEVGGGGLVEGLEREVVDEEHVDGGEAAVLGFGAVVEAGGFEAFEQVAGAGHVDGEAAADGDVAQGGGQVGLADADGSQYQSAVGGFGEAEADELVP